MGPMPLSPASKRS
uniref:Uncharacterized protein n=1 Tax=Arundo donax TaxID=35708 RepID=A0A0A8XWB6_ARUDO